MTNRYTLYIDESGIRYPQHGGQPRRDGMDWFAWGGVLVKKEDEDKIVEKYKEFSKKWNLKYPLHSCEIRGKRDNFSWLKNEEQISIDFYIDLNEFLTTIPVIGFGVVVSRPGYNERYIKEHGNNRWELCKTTYPILIERTVRYLLENDPEAILNIIFEGASGAENKKIVEYGKSLKNDGHPFNKATAGKYSPVTSDVYKQILSGKPKSGTKDNIFLQIADLYVYPMAKFKYDPDYLAWHKLYKSQKLIDSILEPEEIYLRGIKYYCFNK